MSDPFWRYLEARARQVRGPLFRCPCVNRRGLLLRRCVLWRWHKLFRVRHKYGSKP